MVISPQAFKAVPVAGPPGVGVGVGVGAGWVLAVEATVNASAPVTLFFNASDTMTLKAYVPAVEGVPDRSPLELTEKPCGKEDCAKLHV